MGTKLSTDERRKLRVRRQLKKVANGRPGLRFTGRQSIFTRKLSTIRRDALWRRPQPRQGLCGEKGGNVEAAGLVKQIAERAIKAGVENVIFDRGGYIYHGRVKALAEAAREAGLKF